MSVQHDDLVREIRLFIADNFGLDAMSVKVDTPGLVYTRDGRPFQLGAKGTLDIEATIKGRSVWIDAKTGRDRLKPAQQKFCAAKERAGAIAFAARSVEDVRIRLAKEGLL